MLRQFIFLLLLILSYPLASSAQLPYYGTTAILDAEEDLRTTKLSPERPGTWKSGSGFFRVKDPGRRD